MIAGQVQLDAHLAVGDLTRSAGVLPRHTRRGVPVLEEASVVDDQRFRADRLVYPRGQPGPYMRRTYGLEVMKWARAGRLLSSPRRAAIGSTDLRLPSSSSPRT